MNSPLKWLLYTSPIVFPSRVSRWRLTLPAARSSKPSGLMTPILVFMDDSCSFAPEAQGPMVTSKRAFRYRRAIGQYGNLTPLPRGNNLSFPRGGPRHSHVQCASCGAEGRYTSVGA